MTLDAINNNNFVPLSPIQEFYSGANIFITGATGFMGKCLLEKLLRSCPDLNKIYILVREKKGKKVDKRVEELFQDVLFSKLRSVSNKYLDKIFAICGNISSPGLGIKLEDRVLLQRDVNIVFHVAATVNFNEKLPLAVAINVNGTKEVLNLCRDMDKLKSVVHVSTVYSNCHLRTVDEKFYKYSITYKELPSLIEKLDDKSIEKLTPKILGDWPNTYAFTKAMAEDLVKDNLTSLPLSIFRPAIVVSTWKEPLKGWIDNIYGPTGLCAGALLGVLSSLWCDDKIKANIVPVDYTINALIACAWHTGVRTKEGIKREIIRNNDELWENYNDVKDKHNDVSSLPCLYNSRELNYNTINPAIFNYVSTVEKPITWKEFIGINLMFAENYPLNQAIWCLNFKCTNSYFLHTLSMKILHFIPALVVDCFAVIFLQKPRLLKIYKQTNKLSNIVSYFCTREWQFYNNNTQRLWQLVDSRDKIIFPFSMAQMDWLEYFQTYINGMRKYLCKDDDSTIPAAVKKQNRFIFAAKCLKLIFHYICIYTIIRMFKNLFNYF